MKFSDYLGKNEDLLSDVRIRETVGVIRSVGCDENEFGVELARPEGPGRVLGEGIADFV